MAAFFFREFKPRGGSAPLTRFFLGIGFHPLSQEKIKPPLALSHPEGWLGLSLTNDPIETIPSRCSCVTALDDPAYW
ncbi:MAG: hypothetical protein ACOC0U_05160 [Desulfovibrionales bacterium]